MKPKYVLTQWQKRHKQLLDEAMQNYDVYQELGYIRRDTNSVLSINESEAYIDERLLRLMHKYGIHLAVFEVLKKFCQQGGGLDYSLIRKREPAEPVAAKKHPRAELHRKIYNMWIRQLKSIADIADELREQGILNSYTRADDINLVSHTIRRMNASDVNRSKTAGSAPGRRAATRKKT